ncbi:MAG: Clp protease N-terminal domain-containing protein [Gaiellales bacterium]
MRTVFERFTEQARQAIVYAQTEAGALDHNFIGTEHLLLGLLHDEDTLAARVLSSLDIELEGVRSQVVRIVGRGDPPAPADIPFTPRAKKVLELSLREALSLSSTHIGTEHILLGLVRENEGVAARILQDHGADAETIRMETMRLMPRVGFAARASGPRPQFRISCPNCARTLESVTTDAPNTVFDVTAEGERECPGCGSRWAISYRVAWKAIEEGTG